MYYLSRRAQGRREGGEGRGGSGAQLAEQGSWVTQMGAGCCPSPGTLCSKKCVFKRCFRFMCGNIHPCPKTTSSFVYATHTHTHTPLSNVRLLVVGGYGTAKTNNASVYIFHGETGLCPHSTKTPLLSLSQQKRVLWLLVDEKGYSGSLSAVKLRSLNVQTFI